jgi:4-amino-4-deoxy-L-arabinose transferase-like glycosyltransferase
VSTAPTESLPKADRRRLVVIGLLRALATTVVVVAAYYLLPLDNLAGISLGVALAVGLLTLTAVVAYQVQAIIRHPHSAVRAIEALAITVPVFLLLFAATYFMMEQSNPDNLNVDALTRTDSLYFTVTVFATVGFGDITATSQAARVVVIAQMILDLLVLGLVVKVFLGAVETGKGLRTTRQESESS